MPGWTLADVTYDPVTHASSLPDGRDVPHVTHILEAVGVSTDFEALADRSPRMAHDIALAGARGTAVHADCHAYDDDDLDWGTVDPRVGSYVEAWVRCRKDKGLVPLAHARERRVFNPHVFYAGILDGIFQCGRKRILVDIKTGDPDAAAAEFQTAAYEAAFALEHPDQPINERWAVVLQPRLRVPYRIVNYTARPDSYLDFGKFVAFVTTYNNQAVRRLRHS